MKQTSVIVGCNATVAQEQGHSRRPTPPSSRRAEQRALLFFLNGIRYLSPEERDDDGTVSVCVCAEVNCVIIDKKRATPLFTRFLKDIEMRAADTPILRAY